MLSHLEPDDPRRWRLEQVLTALEHLSDQPNSPFTDITEERGRVALEHLEKAAQRTDSFDADVDAALLRLYGSG